MRFCTYCEESLWPNAPDEMLVKGNRPYCNKGCYTRHKLIQRRESRADPQWTHNCSDCDRPMFTPVGMNGWYCPECDRGESIDKSYWEWHCETQAFGRSEFERACHKCESRLWLFDGALVCHNEDCDAHIVQYGREWWAMLESEYPNKENELTEQATL